MINYTYLIIDDQFFRPTKCQEKTKQIAIPRTVYEKILSQSKTKEKDVSKNG